jgi:hypothetical protein
VNFLRDNPLSNDTIDSVQRHREVGRAKGLLLPVHIKENTDVLVFANKENGLEVNTDKTEHMVMSRDQNAGRSQNIKADYRSFKRMEQFKRLGTNLRYQNSI